MHLENVVLLLAHPDIDVNLTRHESGSPLVIALRNKQFAIAERLLADPRVRGDFIAADGVTALIGASYHGATEIVRKLLQMPGVADTLGATTKKGCTALSYAVSGRHTEIVELLVAAVPTACTPTVRKSCQ
jgi:ankyrin repeat protein